MKVLIPVSRYLVSYNEASGRPYSSLERLVLEAIREGTPSLDGLAGLFQLHRRVLAEAVSTLMQAGWVAILKSNHALVATRSGQEALCRKGSLPGTILVQEKTAYLVGERVTGQVVRGEEVRYVSKTQFAGIKDRVAILPSEDIPHPLDPGILAPHLRRTKGSWIRNVVEAAPFRSGADYMVVHVDLKAKKVTGLPKAWLPLIQDLVIDAAFAKAQELERNGLPSPDDSELRNFVGESATPASREQDHPDGDVQSVALELDPNLDHLVVGVRQHRELWEDFLDKADFLFALSPHLEATTIREWRDSLQAALRRDSLIGFLQGRAKDGREPGRVDEQLQAEFMKLNSESSGRGALAVGSTQSWGRSGLIIAKVGDAIEAVIGAGDWLNPAADRETGEVFSFRFTEPAVVARLARMARDLAARDRGLAAGFVPISLDGLAALLESRSVNQEAFPSSSGQPGGENPPTVQFLVGNQHLGALKEMAEGAKTRLIVGAPHWGRGDLAWLVPAFQRATCRRRELLCGANPGGEGATTEQRERLDAAGVTGYETAVVGTAFAVADDDRALITSLDWMAGEQASKAPTALSDIGVLVQGGAMAARLLAVMKIPERRVHEAVADGIFVSSFQVANLRSITAVRWALDGAAAPGWHVLLGNNGAGKSTILAALAMALVGREYAERLNRSWHHPIRDGGSAAKVSLSFQGDALSPGLPEGLDGSIQVNWSPGAVYGVTSLRHSLDSATCQKVFSMGYGALRRFRGGESIQADDRHRIPEIARYLSLFDSRYDLADALAWLRTLDHRSANMDVPATVLLATVKVLINECGLLPGGVKLDRITPDQVLFADGQGQRYEIGALSDGFSAILTLILDIVRNLSDRYPPAQLFHPDQPEVIIAPGIVLIDEVDIHLHPSWQRTIGSWMVKHFPRIQFFVTTHSPLVCQAAELGTVCVLPDLDGERPDAGGMLLGGQRNQLIYGNVLEAYESLAFGTGIGRSESAQKLRARLAELNGKELEGEDLTREELVERRELRERLNTRSVRTGMGSGGGQD